MPKQASSGEGDIITQAEEVAYNENNPQGVGVRLPPSALFSSRQNHNESNTDYTQKPYMSSSSNFLSSQQKNKTTTKPEHFHNSPLHEICALCVPEDIPEIKKIIQAWPNLSESEKKQVLKIIEDRL